MTKNELRDYLENEAGYGAKRVCSFDSYELIDKWLRYNGIIGFTDDIIEVVKAAYGLTNN